MAEMPNVISGNTITSAWGNQIRDRTIQRYATAAARTAAHPTPTEGDLSYRQDANIVEVYNGSAWVTMGPLGLMGQASKSADQTGITAVADVSGLSVTFTAVTGRSYRLSAFLRFQKLTNAGDVAGYITDAANTSQVAGNVSLATLGFGTMTLFCIVTGSGSVTYKVRAASSTATVTVLSAATAKTWLIAEDIG